MGRVILETDMLRGAKEKNGIRGGWFAYREIDRNLKNDSPARAQGRWPPVGIGGRELKGESYKGESGGL